MRRQRPDRGLEAYVARLNALRIARREADPQWLDKRIAQAFEREFANEYAATMKPKQVPSLPRRKSRQGGKRKAA
jgi:hypothetical protein